ncbi:MAG: serine protease [Spirochaetaceae bacterium]|jgi:serine protease Do|nr:serine protease [Spirochaetaceae bacterium]
MIRRICGVFVLLCLPVLATFAQSAGAIRDYVGLINQTYHPDIVSYIEKFKVEFERQGNTDAIRSVDRFLKGPFGTGFVYVAPNGDNFIITNNHVIAQSYSLSVTFEKVSGEQTRYDGLSIVAADEELDIAILAFPGGERPFQNGLTISTELVDEGTDVFSAGFPSLGGNPVYQFGRGIVSNASVRIPREDNEEILMGPYIQHTAQIDAGNSGGPLLIAQAGVPAGYAVLAINTLSAYRRQAANYSIPGSTAMEYINAALDPVPVNGREALDKRLDAFIAEVNVPRAVYKDIAKYLSYVCVAENTEYAISEIEDRRNSNRTVWNDIVEAFNDYPVNGMRLAVAWAMENSMRTRSGIIRISLEDVREISPAEYEVTFTVNGNTTGSRWVREYGTWRINSFGSVVSGDKSLLAEKERQRSLEDALFTDYSFMVQAGYTHVFERGAAVNAAMRFGGRSSLYSMKAVFSGSNFWQAELGWGFFVPVRLTNFAIMPLFGLGFGAMKSGSYIKSSSNIEESDIRMGVSVEAGLLFTTAKVRGLFLSAIYQHNFYTDFGHRMAGAKDTYPDKNYLLFSVGYGF